MSDAPIIVLGTVMFLVVHIGFPLWVFLKCRAVERQAEPDNDRLELLHYIDQMQKRWAREDSEAAARKRMEEKA